MYIFIFLVVIRAPSTADNKNNPALSSSHREGDKPNVAVNHSCSTAPHSESSNETNPKPLIISVKSEPKDIWENEAISFCYIPETVNPSSFPGVYEMSTDSESNAESTLDLAKLKSEPRDIKVEICQSNDESFSPPGVYEMSTDSESNTESALDLATLKSEPRDVKVEICDRSNDESFSPSSTSTQASDEEDLDHPTAPILATTYWCQFPDCTKHFKASLDLREHISLKHRRRGRDSKGGYYGLGKLVTRICDTCGKVFRDIHGLNRHSNIHNDNSGESKPNRLLKSEWPKCFSCGARYSRVLEMARHWKSSDSCTPTSDQERRYANYLKREDLNVADEVKCPLCEYSTCHSKHFLRHIFFHWNKGDKVPAGYKLRYVECPLCTHKCCDPQKLRRHLVTHRDTKCPRVVDAPFKVVTT